jgi:Protein of unknown function (DUF3421)
MEDPMRAITISAGLLATVVAGQAIAGSPDIWFPRYQGDYGGKTEPLTFDSIVGGWKWSGAKVEPLFICRTHERFSYPGFVTEKAESDTEKTCQYVSYPSAGTDPNYDVLRPTWQDCDTVSACNGTGVPVNATHQGGHGIAKTIGVLPVKFYFCRALSFEYGPYGIPINLSLQVGRIAPDSKGCLVPYGGQERVYTSYGVLVDASPALPVTTANVTVGGSIPLDALVGGWDLDGKPFYFCQASYNGALVPGKTKPEFNGCHITWLQKEINVPPTQKDAWGRNIPYQVLVPLWKKNPSTSSSLVATDEDVCRYSLDTDTKMPKDTIPGEWRDHAGKCYTTYDAANAGQTPSNARVEVLSK